MGNLVAGAQLQLILSFLPTAKFPEPCTARLGPGQAPHFFLLYSYLPQPGQDQVTFPTPSPKPDEGWATPPFPEVFPESGLGQAMSSSRHMVQVGPGSLLSPMPLDHSQAVPSSPSAWPDRVPLHPPHMPDWDLTSDLINGQTGCC